MSFLTFPLDQPKVMDLSGDVFPSWGTAFHERAHFHEDQTHFGYVFDSQTRLTHAHGDFKLLAGMYFSVPGACRLVGGRGLVISRLNYKGFFHIGGPVEKQGRLRYIDGCTDSLLIPPPLLGDPCLNLLCFPPRIRQTAHTHPSFRFGMVVDGSGFCLFDDQRVALRPGTAFFIGAQTLHCFHTRDQAMRVIAFHPDSDFGPDHDNHPMINRTIVEGTSARYLNQIRTQRPTKSEMRHEMSKM